MEKTENIILAANEEAYRIYRRRRKMNEKM